MKFCKYCGAQLDDNAVCGCEKSRAEAARNSAQQVNNVSPQNNSQFSSPNVQPQQSPYAVGTQPMKENAFVKALKNIPIVFMSFWKDSKAVVKTAIAEKDIVLASLFTAIFFIALLLGNLFYVLSIPYISNYFLNFGFVILSSLITTAFICGFYSLFVFAVDKKTNPSVKSGTAYINALITFGIESIPASLAFLAGGIFSFASNYLGMIFAMFAVIYLIISLLNNMKYNELFRSKTLSVITAAGAITAAVAVTVLIWYSLMSLCAVSTILNI